MSLVVYLQKQKAKGKPLSPADEKVLNACQPNKPKQDKWKLPPAAEKNEEETRNKSGGIRSTTLPTTNFS